jgi:hypothetical protein
MSFIDIVLMVMAFASPLVFIALFIALFTRGGRGTAVAGLILGFSGALMSIAGGKVHVGGLWGWSSAAPDMGTVLQFFAHALASFSLGALVAAISIRVVRAGRVRPA